MQQVMCGVSWFLHYGFGLSGGEVVIKCRLQIACTCSFQCYGAVQLSVRNLQENLPTSTWLRTLCFAWPLHIWDASSRPQHCAGWEHGKLMSEASAAICMLRLKLPFECNQPPPALSLPLK
eukprot:2084430-Amphidinium_carterae.1